MNPITIEGNTNDAKLVSTSWAPLVNMVQAARYQTLTELHAASPVNHSADSDEYTASKEKS
jgi:hypothetical protein